MQSNFMVPEMPKPNDRPSRCIRGQAGGLPGPSPLLYVMRPCVQFQRTLFPFFEALSGFVFVKHPFEKWYGVMINTDSTRSSCCRLKSQLYFTSSEILGKLFNYLCLSYSGILVNWLL